jgi:putative Holliday junction resolvase
VDLGDARIGLALSDPLGLTAQPLGYLEGGGRAASLARVVASAREHGAVTIVVGHPRLMSGQSGERALAAERFADALRAALGIHVVLWDERLTSVAAQKTLIDGGVRRRRRREVVDAIAAALILQGWLDAQRSSST